MIYLNKFEDIKIPIEVGDIVLGGRFKNKKTFVKKIGKNKKGDITINNKPLLKYRIVKESQQDIDYHFKHLEDDGFNIYTNYSDSERSLTIFIRIFKPKSQTLTGTRIVYSYSNCQAFKWSEIGGEISRYIDEFEHKDHISYVTVVRSENLGCTSRFQISIEEVLNDDFDAGEILSFTLGFVS